MRGFSKILKHPAVDLISDERSSDSGIWVELKKGWIDPFSGCHSIHEDTIKEIMIKLLSVKKCECEDCLK